MSADPRGTIPAAQAEMKRLRAPVWAFFPLKADTPRSFSLRLSSRVRLCRLQYSAVVFVWRLTESPSICPALENRMYEYARFMGFFFPDFPAMEKFWGKVVKPVNRFPEADASLPKSACGILEVHRETRLHDAPVTPRPGRDSCRLLTDLHLRWYDAGIGMAGLLEKRVWYPRCRRWSGSWWFRSPRFRTCPA